VVIAGEEEKKEEDTIELLDKNMISPGTIFSKKLSEHL